MHPALSHVTSDSFCHLQVARTHLPVKDPFAGFVEGDVGNGGCGEHWRRFARAQLRNQIANQWQVGNDQCGSDTFIAQCLKALTRPTSPHGVSSGRTSTLDGRFIHSPTTSSVCSARRNGLTRPRSISTFLPLSQVAIRRDSSQPQTVKGRTESLAASSAASP